MKVSHFTAGKGILLKESFLGAAIQVVAAIYILAVIGAIVVFLAAYFLAGLGLFPSLLAAFVFGFASVTALVVGVMLLAARRDKSKSARSKIPSVR